jgi:hypothetical protein
MKSVSTNRKPLPRLTALKDAEIFCAEQTYAERRRTGSQQRCGVIALIRANPDKAVTGQEWNYSWPDAAMPIRGLSRGSAMKPLQTAMGPQACLHLSKAPPADSKDQQLDIWLAPGLDWYPVRLRFSDADGDFVDQT